MFKNDPSENGWINLHHVREALSPKRPEPIPEIFTVPPQYSLPDDKFHNDLVERICSSEGEIITLTGKPGLGKSTYLSYLCQTLEEKEIPLIRHHYFLSLGDTTEDRLSPRAVAESLLHQIQSTHQEANADTSLPENLRAAIKKCASYYQKINKPFVILIDGLDHVWRDNARNKKPLDETFRQLLPIIDNMVLLVGTQPVDDSLLPELLLDFSAKNKWLWLPSMTGNSIFEFLQYQVDSGRIQMNTHKDHMKEEIQSSAQKLLEVTSGYPLHVIYSYEFLAQNGKPLNSWEIEKLPPCTDDTIETYYQTLWRKLTYKQQDVLHLCCGFQFAWPRSAIGLVLSDSTDHPPSVNAVSHMLFESFSGVRPFHESLVVFVKSQNDHQIQINLLLARVCEWLEKSAPSYLKDSWLWSSLARSGDSMPLRQGLSRDWVLDRLTVGIPVRTCIRLLTEAETYAFQELNYAEAYKHRELKTRLINGPKFQTWDSPSLETLSLVCATKEAIDQELSSQNEYSPKKLAILAISLWQRGDNKIAAILSKKAIDRHRTKSKLFNDRNNQDEESEVAHIIKAGVLANTLNYELIFESDNFSKWPNSYVNSFNNACLLKKDLTLLAKAYKNLYSNSTEHDIRGIALSLLRTSIIDGADITSRPEYALLSLQELPLLLNALDKNNHLNIQTYFPTSEYVKPLEITSSFAFHEWFFSSLTTRLLAEGNFSWLPIKVKQNEIREVDASTLFNLLNELAEIVAHKLIEDSVASFDFVCTLFPKETLLDQTHHEDRRAEILLKIDWIRIAADCHLLTVKRQISLSELSAVLDYGLFRTDWLRSWYKEIGLDVLADDAAQLLIESELARQTKEIEQTIEYSNGSLELAEIAYRHGNNNLFFKCLRLTWDYVLGYGHHKDTTIFNTLTGIEYLAPLLPIDAMKLLERISSIVFNISNFTDGDETRHSKAQMFDLLATLSPQTIASIYDGMLRNGEWHYADLALSALIKNSKFSSPIVKQIFLTGVNTDCYKALHKAIESGDEDAKNIKHEIESFLGISLEEEIRNERYSSSHDYSEKIDIKAEEYPPEHLNDLMHVLKGKYGTRNFWIDWYDHWVTQGKETDLLNNLLSIVSNISNTLDDKRHLLDKLFISQKKLNGKAKAFDLLVAAHKAKNGWSEWYETTTNTIERLDILVEIYPNRIDEFVTLTTEKSKYWHDQLGGLIIPDDKLVYLLIKSGRINEALGFVQTMLNSLEESLRNLNLQKPNWDWNNDDSIEDSLAKILISRLKLPIPSVKLWVINQASALLKQSNPLLEKFILNDLCSRQQESECIEMLSLLLIAKDMGYKPPCDIGCHIKARSVLSDMILDELTLSSNNYGEYAADVVPIIHLTSDNHRFNHFHGSHIPQVYNTLLDHEERRTGIPWTSFYRSEWNNTFEYYPSYGGNSIDYFLSSDRFRSAGQFYTTASHRGRSAFLRTLEIAKQYFGMPDSYARNLATQALPIEPAYTGMTPRRPSWISTWPNKCEPKKEAISDYVKKCIADFDSLNNRLDLVALSFPIKINTNTWIDITVVKAITDQRIPSSFDIPERSKAICIGNKLERHLTYDYQDSNNNKNSDFLLATTTYPLIRYGHWHSDIESRGIYIPYCRIPNKSVMASTNNEVLEFQVDDINIGHASYWNNYWNPAHPKQIRSLCGTFTVIEPQYYSKLIPPITKNTQYFYTCKATILNAKEPHQEFEAREINFIICQRGNNNAID